MNLSVGNCSSFRLLPNGPDELSVGQRLCDDAVGAAGLEEGQLLGQSVSRDAHDDPPEGELCAASGPFMLIMM